MKEIFIGREDIYSRLSKDVFMVQKENYGRSYSLIGPNGIGKTTLIRQLAKDFSEAKQEHVFLFQCILDAETTFWTFWGRLLDQFSKEITKTCLEDTPYYDNDTVRDILTIYDFYNINNGGKIENDNELKFRANMYLNEIFEYYTDLGIRIIITIDEFDRAKSIFKNGQFFQRLFGLTSKGAARLNLSIITISRRSVSTIAHGMQEGSNFQDAFPPLPLKGFTDNELKQYFETYSSIGINCLSEDKKKQIICLCGRNPGLLMGIRHEIELLENDNISVAEIYSEHGLFINTAYDRLCTLMKDEYVDYNKTINCMGIFTQQFIGPVYMENVPMYMEMLYNYGFVTKPMSNDNNIFELSGLEEYRDKGNLLYEPLSPFFVDYVKYNIVPSEKNSMAGMLEDIELRIRNMISDLMSLEYPETWEDVINSDVPQKQDYLDNLRVVASNNDVKGRGIVISKLNVMAFRDYFVIIKKHWDLFSSYFISYGTVEELKADMEILNEARNLSAHRNIEIFNDHSRTKLKTVCEKMLGCFQVIDVTQRDTDNHYKQDGITSADNGHGNLPQIGEKVTISQLRIKKGAIEGEFKYGEDTLWANIGAKYLQYGSEYRINERSDIEVYIIGLLPQCSNRFESIPVNIDGLYFRYPDSYVDNLPFGTFVDFFPSAYTCKGTGFKGSVNGVNAVLNKKYLDKQMLDIVNNAKLEGISVSVRVIDVNTQGNGYRLFC